MPALPRMSPVVGSMASLEWGSISVYDCTMGSLDNRNVFHMVWKLLLPSCQGNPIQNMFPDCFLAVPHIQKQTDSQASNYNLLPCLFAQALRLHGEGPSFTVSSKHSHLSQALPPSTEHVRLGHNK